MLLAHASSSNQIMQPYIWSGIFFDFAINIEKIAQGD
jgi:hypothetical protein